MDINKVGTVVLIIEMIYKVKSFSFVYNGEVGINCWKGIPQARQAMKIGVSI